MLGAAPRQGGASVNRHCRVSRDRAPPMPRHGPHEGIGGGLQLTRSPAILTPMARPALQISKLTPAERLHLLEELWESLCDTPEAVPLTEAQRTELDRRLDDLEQDAPTGIPWDDVVRRIRNSR